MTIERVGKNETTMMNGDDNDNKDGNDEEEAENNRDEGRFQYPLPQYIACECHQDQC